MSSIDRLRLELDRLFAGAPSGVRDAYSAAWKVLNPKRPPKAPSRPPEPIEDDDYEPEPVPRYRSAPVDDYRDPFANPITAQDLADLDRNGYIIPERPERPEW